MIHEISQISLGYDFYVASHEKVTVLFGGTASNEINLSAHNVDCFRSYFTKRCNVKTALFLTIFTQSFNHVWLPVYLILTMIC